MTAPFDTRELRRLSACLPGPWLVPSQAEGDTGDSIRDALGRPIATVHELACETLIAYLGTHREAILRMLEAGERLAAVGQFLRPQTPELAEELREAMAAWEAAEAKP